MIMVYRYRWDSITSPLSSNGSVCSSPQIYPLHSEGKYIYTSVFIGRPAGIAGLVAVDHATEVVSPLGEITYSSE